MLSNLKSEGQNQRAPMQAWPKIIKTSQWHRVVSVCEAAGAHLPSWDVRHSIPEQELLPESPSSAVSLPWGWKEVDVNKRLYLSLRALEGQCFPEDLLIQQRVKWTLGQLDGLPVQKSCNPFSCGRLLLEIFRFAGEQWVSGTQSALGKYVLTEQMKMHTQFRFGANDIFQV